jgi:hypothetical protein
MSKKRNPAAFGPRAGEGMIAYINRLLWAQIGFQNAGLDGFRLTDGELQALIERHFLDSSQPIKKHRNYFNNAHKSEGVPGIRLPPKVKLRKWTG